MHDWTAMLTDGNLLGLERFAAVIEPSAAFFARLSEEPRLDAVFSRRAWARRDI